MTTTEVEPEPKPAELAAGTDDTAAAKGRAINAILLPLASMVAIFVYVYNISRVFLAGGDGAETVIIGSVVTVAILGGATLIAASPRLRTSSLVMVLAIALLLVMSAGLVTLGPSEEKKAAGGGGYKQPTGPAVNTLDVDAVLPFTTHEYTAPAGINEIVYVAKSVPHTLVFSEAKYAGWELKVDAVGKNDQGKVDLTAGKYTIYCTIPGHRAAGMEATLTVTAAAGGTATTAGATTASSGAKTP
jgi:plastocyanin